MKTTFLNSGKIMEIDANEIYEYIKKDLEENNKPSTKNDIREAYIADEICYLERIYNCNIEDNLQNESTLEVIFNNFDNFLKTIK